MPDGKRAAVRQGEGTGAVMVRVGMRYFRPFLSILLIFLFCSLCHAKSQLGKLTEAKMNELLPMMVMMDDTWVLTKTGEVNEANLISRSYKFSDTFSFVWRGKPSGKVEDIIITITFDENIPKEIAALKWIDESKTAVDMLGTIAINNYLNPEYSEIRENFIKHLSLENTKIIKGKKEEADIKKQHMKFAASFSPETGFYLLSAEGY